MRVLCHSILALGKRYIREVTFIFVQEKIWVLGGGKLLLCGVITITRPRDFCSHAFLLNCII